MISIETVRSAALSDTPWDRLDELVRAELATGRKVKELAGDLLGMADEVWGTPGLSDDGQDALGDTLDALTGNCHSDYCYTDSPAPGPSSPERGTVPGANGNARRPTSDLGPAPSPVDEFGFPSPSR